MGWRRLVVLAVAGRLGQVKGYHLDLSLELSCLDDLLLLRSLPVRIKQDELRKARADQHERGYGSARYLLDGCMLRQFGFLACCGIVLRDCK